MIDPRPDLTSSAIVGLGWLYVVLCALNVGWTIHCARQNGSGHPTGKKRTAAGLWALYSTLLAAAAAVHFVSAAQPDQFWFRLPAGFKNTADFVIGRPVAYSALLLLGFVLMIWWRRWLAKPAVGWCLLNVSLLFLALSLTDWDFRQIVGKPDNVPIVAMLYLFGFFMWLYFHRAVENDTLREAGKPLLSEEDNEKVLVWPDLVYIELICMIAATALLIVWGIALQAPLEEPASQVRTPNPSKAPWYFLGLQEMLVYYDPWLAGVCFPTLIILGLMAIPFLDFNKRGSGYYTFNERRFAVTTFLFGLFLLWVPLIVLGTFLRGPNWTTFGLYEYWDVHKLKVLSNVNLSEYFWLDWLKASMPENVFVRELPGILVVLVYLCVLPIILAVTVFRTFLARMGLPRYVVFSVLLLLMAALPIKMILCWSMNLKYLIAIPEWFLNI